VGVFDITFVVERKNIEAEEGRSIGGLFPKGKRRIPISRQFAETVRTGLAGAEKKFVEKSYWWNRTGWEVKPRAAGITMNVRKARG